jgi:hypothetical protein
LTAVFWTSAPWGVVESVLRYFPLSWEWEGFEGGGIKGESTRSVESGVGSGVKNGLWDLKATSLCD